MLFVSDFFTRHKEAVSNQLELLAEKQSGKIIAATRFMGQRALHKDDTRDGIFVVPSFTYPIILAAMILSGRDAVHVFEEESFWWKKALFNMSRRPLYVSLYRRPELEHIDYLRSYKYLQKIFVELPVHKEMLIKHGFKSHQISIAPTPAKIGREKSTKEYNPKDVSIVFASWNNSEPNALYNRGLVYLLDLLVSNPECSLSIPLRDSKIDEFLSLAKEKSVESRINLLEIKSIKELESLYDQADFVAFTAQDRIVKDVPNSLIDGLSYGKPSIITDVLDFWTVVDENKVGIVIKQGTSPERLNITANQYKHMSKRAYDYSANHTPDTYQRLGTDYRLES